MTIPNNSKSLSWPSQSPCRLLRHSNSTGTSYRYIQLSRCAEQRMPSFKINFLDGQARGFNGVLYNLWLLLPRSYKCMAG